MWVKPCYSASGIYCFFNAVGGSSQIKIYDQNGTIKFYITDGTVTHTVTLIYDAGAWSGKWHYIGVSWDNDSNGASAGGNSIARLYVDGTLAGNSIESGALMPSFGLTQFAIGTESGGGNPANSTLDEFCIYIDCYASDDFLSNYGYGRFKTTGNYTSRNISVGQGNVLGTIFYQELAGEGISFKIDYGSGFQDVLGNGIIGQEVVNGNNIKYQAVLSGSSTASPVLDEVVITYISSPDILYRRENSRN
jgi:hypothetical protein